MNVLIFVMTMLMLMALMTYARFETYRTSQVFQLFFNEYMENDERAAINTAMYKQYKTTKGSSKEKKGDTTSKVEANRRVSLALLVDKTKREKQSKEWEQTQILLKNLIKGLYDEQPFYQKAVQERPQVVSELISDLVKTIDALPEQKKIKKAAELANLTLSDKFMNEFLYKMLHGAPYKEIIKDQTTLLQPVGKNENTSVETDENDETIQADAEEFKSAKGYYSLLDFVNLTPTYKIRVFLAPREVLAAVFPEKTTVDDIISQRVSLYKQLVGGADGAQLKDAFQNQFESRRAPDIDKSMLEFSVTKTNPTID